MTELSHPPSKTRSRMSLLLIIAVFALPILAAAVLNMLGWMPGHSRNFGEVVHPPINLREVEFVGAADARTHLANDKETWTLLVRVPAGCDAACWQRVALLGNVRTSLARNADKLDLLLLEREPPPAQRDALAGFAFAAPTTPLPDRLSAPLAAGPELWLVSPYGLVEMRYAPGYVPGELRKDLGKLIR
ncbi:MAG: hypothetical protein ACREO3_03405 [Arenimonas sp.]